MFPPPPVRGGASVLCPHLLAGSQQDCGTRWDQSQGSGSLWVGCRCPPQVGGFLTQSPAGKSWGLELPGIGTRAFLGFLLSLSQSPNNSLESECQKVPARVTAWALAGEGSGQLGESFLPGRDLAL